MNDELILNWLIEDVKRNAERCYDVDVWKRDLKVLLSGINSGRDISLPLVVTSKDIVDEGAVISILKETFKNNISNISLTLNYLYPQKYLFYRVSFLENEIFAGFKFFSQIYEKFQFSFSKIGHNKNSFENYLILNEALLSFSHDTWPNLEDPKSIQKRINYFLFDVLAPLFFDKNNYNRYWILVSSPKDFSSLDNEIETTWSGRKEMQIGDLVFMYRQSPRKAITEIYKVSGKPYFDAYLGWGGFYVPLRKITSIRDITMIEMKHDLVLNNWSFVKAQSQGVTAGTIPYSIYNRLLEKIGKEVYERLGLSPESIGQEATSGTYSSEEEFEDKIIEPLLKHWRLKFKRQYPCYFTVGSQYHTCYVDFIIQDEKGDLTLFEDKLEIVNESQLKKAVLQAKSYSLLLGMKSFVVASPEGFWIYRVERNQEILLNNIKTNKLDECEELMRNLIIKIRS